MAHSTSKAMGSPNYTPLPLSNQPQGVAQFTSPSPTASPYPDNHSRTRPDHRRSNRTQHTRQHLATIGATMSTNPRYRNGWRREQLRKRVLAAYDVCAICGQPVDKTLHTPHPLSAEVDEIIPVSRGGNPLAWDNVRLTHRRCNRLKSNRSDEYARAQLTRTPQPKATSLPLNTSTW